MNIANQLTALDSLDVLVVVDNETDTLSSVAEGIPQIPEALRRCTETHTVLFDVGPYRKGGWRTRSASSRPAIAPAGAPRQRRRLRRRTTRRVWSALCIS